MYLRLLAVGLSTAAVLGSIVACSSDSTNNGTTPTTPDAGPVDAGPGVDSSPGPVTITVTPTTPNVLTCSTLQFTESGGKGGGTWAVSPATGAINSSGLYTAPTTGGSTAAAIGVTYTEGSASGAAEMNVATAFLGTPSLLTLSNDDVGDNVPFDKQFSASGSSMYAALLNKDTNHVDVSASTDNGKTWGTPVSVHTGKVECATVAADAGNPSVVYLAYYAGHGDAGTNTGATVRLAVSTDGAKTFPTTYTIADSNNSIPNLICPDVVSPSADHVIVSGVVTDFGVDNSPTHVGLWTSSNRGAGIGTAATSLACTDCPADGSAFYGTSDKNTGAVQTTKGILINGNGYSPRLATNGKGAACVTFQYDEGSTSSVQVQCSADNGGTWTSVLGLGSPSAIPVVAVSPTGKVAVGWTATGDDNKEQAFATISTDGGKTFAAPFHHPTLDGSFPVITPPTLAWETDDILWVSETVNNANFDTLFVDKTCDDGKTWSGAMSVGRFDNTSLLMTSKGMFAMGFNTSTPSVAAISLSPQQ